MRGGILIILLVIKSVTLFSQDSLTEKLLENYLDSSLDVINIDYSDIETEFLSYVKINYKKCPDIQNAVHHLSHKLSEKTKLFSPENLIYYKHLKLLSYYSNESLKNLEKYNYNLIRSKKQWTEARFSTLLYIFLHEINYWNLSVYKPNVLAKKLNKLYLSTTNKVLVDKLVLFVLIEKIYNAKRYIKRVLKCESKHSKIIVIPIRKMVQVPNEYSFPKEFISPKFPGGEDFMTKYIVDNFEYPRKAIENKIEGTVNISFIIDTLGEIQNIRILNSKHEWLSLEAIRIIESMPSWYPGFITKQPVQVQYLFPIHFKLESKKATLASHLSDYKMIIQ